LEALRGQIRHRTSRTRRSRRKLGGLWRTPKRGAVEHVTGALGPDAAEIEPEGLRELLADRRGLTRERPHRILVSRCKRSRELRWHMRCSQAVHDNDGGHV